ncbi:MAG: hypothetical protein KC877_03260 [Candidatus Kaiserbacteria bacterium]|nr:hypothetical protein [Candidatus Kaiserbacteria bacterium]MCB9816113.1 hypothetical protein [Candidatus Nomurabacteria bacterium]
MKARVFKFCRCASWIAYIVTIILAAAGIAFWKEFEAPVKVVFFVALLFVVVVGPQIWNILFQSKKKVL